MATPAFDLDRFTIESVADVSAATKTFTKPAGARAVQIYAAEAYWVNGGDLSTVLGGDTVSDGATKRDPYAAGVRTDVLPCGGMANIKIKAQTGNLSNVSAKWFF